MHVQWRMKTGLCIAKNQDKLRAEYLQGIFDAIEKGLGEGKQM